MKTHAVLGKDAITHVEQQLGKEVEFLSCAPSGWLLAIRTA